MKFRKYLVCLLLFIFCIPAMTTMTSCQPSYRNARMFTKKKRVQSKHRKTNKKVRSTKKKSSRPINTSYVLKTKKRNSYHY